MNKKIRVLLLFYLLFLAALFSPRLFHRSAEKKIVIGAKNNTECRILSEIIAQLIESRTDAKVERSFYLEGTFIAFEALLSKSIDLYIDYLGTLSLAILQSKSNDPEVIAEELNSRFQITLLDPLGFNNSYCLIARKDFDVDHISGLTKKKVRYGFDPEFHIRPEYHLLRSCYGLNVENFKLMDPSLLYIALHNNLIDVIDGDSTDGRILLYDFKVLDDTQQCFPKYPAYPIVRKETIVERPELFSLLSQLKNVISDKEMQLMNARADQGEKLSLIAKEFLGKLFLEK